MDDNLCFDYEGYIAWTNHIGMRKEDVRLSGILFIVGTLCYARYLVQDFIGSELVPAQAPLRAQCG